jgi:tetratricopeptide (TPR) repeat protein
MRRYRTEIAVCVALLALTAGAMGVGCWNGFTNYDDTDYVTTNQEVRAGLSAAGLRWAFTSFHAANWHPLTWLSLQLDATLFGPEAAWGYHLTNLLLHAANVLLLFLTLRRMTGAVWRGAAVAALFAVHPAHVESVAWIAERKDVLSGFFWMLTLLVYAWYAERPGWRRYLVVLAAFALGLMAKPMVVTLPCVLLLLDYWPLRRLAGLRPAAKLVLEKLPLFALTATACVVTMAAQKDAMSSLERLPLSERLMNTAAAYAAYLGELFWPTKLAVLYPHPHGGLTQAEAGRAVVVLAAVTALALLAWRSYPYLIVGWLWFLGTLVPVIGLVQVGAQSMADRYTYLPYVGLFLALVWGAADLAARRPLPVRSALVPAALLLGACLPLAGLWLQSVHGGVFVFSLLSSALRLIALPSAEMLGDGLFYYFLAGLSAFAVLSWSAGRLAAVVPARVSALAPALALVVGVWVSLAAWQTRLWLNSIWLWEYTVEVTRDNPIAHNQLGDAYWNSKHPERIEKAREQFLACLRLAPQHAKAHNNLALILITEGRLDEAAAHLAAAWAVERKLPVIPLNWGVVLARQGKPAEALGKFHDTLGIAPDLPAAHAEMGRALAALGRWPEAEKEFRDALKPDPTKLDYRADLGWALSHLGRRDEAAEEFAAVAAADPDWAEGARDAAWGFATDPVAGRRSGAEAVRRAEEACAVRGDCDALFRNTLAAARAEFAAEGRE